MLIKGKPAPDIFLMASPHGILYCWAILESLTHLLPSPDVAFPYPQVTKGKPAPDI